MTDAATQYAKQVCAGKIIAGQSVIKACRRHLNDLKKSKTKSYEFYYDESEVERIRVFAEKFCCHSKGKWAGKPVILSDWQLFFLGCIFGWKQKSTHYRRFKYFYVQVAKKNGKSTLLAVVGIYMLVCDGEAGAQIYSAATTRDQAKIIFTEAYNMVKNSPELKKLLTLTKLNISFDSTASFFRPLSADAQTLDGLNTHCALIDEMHAHKNSAVYDNLASSIMAREQPIIGIITTAGLNPQCFCKEQYDYYKNVLNETVENDETFIYIAELDEDDDWNDEKVWIKANPNLNISVFLNHLQTEYKTAKEMKSKQNSFKCKNLNMWVSDAASWANMEKYNLAEDRVTKEQLLGRQCYIGCDLATRNDLAAVVAEFPLGKNEDGKYCYAVIHRSFMPEDRVWELSQEHNVNYQDYIDGGYIIATPGGIVDFDYIEEYIKKLYHDYDVLETCLDPWSASQLEKNLLNEGVKVVEVRQGFYTLSEPTKDMEGIIFDRRLTHYNDPVLKWAVGNVVVTSDENDNIRPNKRRSRYKIDPAVALIIAHTRAMTHDENYFDINSYMEETLSELEKFIQN